MKTPTRRTVCTMPDLGEQNYFRIASDGKNNSRKFSIAREIGGNVEKHIYG